MSVDMAEKTKVGYVPPAIQDVIGNRRRIGRIGLTCHQRVDDDAALCQQFMRAHQRLRAFVVQQASNKSDSKSTRRFLHWSQNVGVDARTGNRGDFLIGHAEIRDDSIVVWILHQDSGVRRFNNKPRSALAIGRMARALAVLDVNAKPNPARALSRTIGNPSAAREPINAGTIATW